MERNYRSRSIANLLKMGHCAPTVMQTVLDSDHIQQEWLVKVAAGMPGGIGNTGCECGGFTSPLILLGLRYGLGHAYQGLPLIFYKGSDLCERFISCNKTLLCKEIRGKDRLPLKCIPVILHAPELHAETIASDCKDAIPEVKRQAYSALYAHLTEKGFHCSHAVFQNLRDTLPDSPELLNGTSGFLGGTLFRGGTCNAFTAGVMAAGLMSAEIENNPLRVIRMIAMMAMGADALADSVNKFNIPVNTGYRMARWFRKEFGSTQCQAITGCDFSSQAGVEKYVCSGCAARCRLIAEKVAQKVQDVLSGSPKEGVKEVEIWQP